MPNTYIALATTTVGAGGAANIDFTSISSAYSDLIIKLSGRTNEPDTGSWVILDFNNSGTTKTQRTLRGDGNGVGTFNQSSGTLTGYTNADNNAASLFGDWQIYIPNYASTSVNKIAYVEFVNETTTLGHQLGTVSVLWPSNSAITSVKLSPNGYNWAQHTVATLYGVANS